MSTERENVDIALQRMGDWLWQNNSHGVVFLQRIAAQIEKIEDNNLRQIARVGFAAGMLYVAEHPDRYKPAPPTIPGRHGGLPIDQEKP